MYICICNGITEDQLKEVATLGLKGGDALRKLGIGDQCGVCVLEALDQLNKNKSEKPKTSERVKK